jgi:hypothetical protein
MVALRFAEAGHKFPPPVRFITCVAATLVLALSVASARASVSAPPPPTVPCDDVILNPPRPLSGGNRLVLGVISVPPLYQGQVEPTHSAPWGFGAKAGPIVRAGTASVTVTVPAAWRKRVAITWGNNTGIVSALRIAGCPVPPNVWNAYAGGFYLRSRSACIPLIFRVGGKSATVRFGVGQRCHT